MPNADGSYYRPFGIRERREKIRRDTTKTARVGLEIREVENRRAARPAPIARPRQRILAQGMSGVRVRTPGISTFSMNVEIENAIFRRSPTHCAQELWQKTVSVIEAGMSTRSTKICASTVSRRRGVCRGAAQWGQRRARRA